ncbi:hypothetical protein BC937DRAFT_86210 [Endogone sp. FLAS-F59071]|nr:hypothetical protein BC937DRAFT_86210 [Endogone sp. FLAS-F59071]|eukprot:RUS20189.1 hypothetical protein BC937DRAFT_86210 [Endogone sp. FLAS-F59071]
MLAQHLGVPQDYNAVFGSGQRNVQSPWVVQETDALMLIAPHQAQNDVILLPALKGINAGNLDLLVQILAHRAVELHVADDVGSLTLVRGDNADLRRENTSFHEACDDFFAVGGFGAVEI